MRIEKLHIPKKICEEKGLKPINLNRLGPVVALVGKNGSGKTRILNLIKNEYPSTAGIINMLDGSFGHLPGQLSMLANDWDGNPVNKEVLFTFYRLIQVNELLGENSTDEKLIDEKKALTLKINNYQTDGRTNQVLNAARNLSSTVNPIMLDTFKKYIIKIDSSKIRALQTVIPSQQQRSPIPVVQLEDLIKDITNQDDRDELEAIYSSALTFLSTLSHSIVGDDIKSKLDTNYKFDDSKTNKQFTSLQRIIKAFLNKKLTWENHTTQQNTSTTGGSFNYQGILKLDGIVFNYSQLSDGEKVLFAYSILFFILDMNPARKIKDSIIIIDEPELNLHPESEIEIINGIRKIIEQTGQLWIATHSLSILSSLNYDEIFMVKDNEIISPKNSTPSNTLVELMGLEGHQERLSNFLSDISNWAYENFMIQCFSDPETILSAQPNDPQVDVFRKNIKDNGAGILLDFGAGKGRVLKEIMVNESLKNKFQLCALEPNEENFKALEKLNLKGYYRSFKDLPDNTFDFILLCNVLHEVQINDWVVTINKLKSALKDKGYIILVEDMVLPKGERISPHGFIILDYPSIQDLFSMNSEPTIILPSDEHYKDRILCSPIQKEQMGDISNDSLKKALKTLQENTLRKIVDLRNTEVDKKQLHTFGRKSAFYTQLFANTSLALAQMP